jgi:hypothetical protein
LSVPSLHSPSADSASRKEKEKKDLCYYLNNAATVNHAVFIEQHPLDSRSVARLLMTLSLSLSYCRCSHYQPNPLMAQRRASLDEKQNTKVPRVLHTSRHIEALNSVRFSFFSVVKASDR